MPYGTSFAARRFEDDKSNRFLAALHPADLAVLIPHLRTVALERGTILHEPGDRVEYVYFPLRGMVSIVAVMRSGASVETVTVGPSGLIGGTAGFGSQHAFGRAIVQLPGAAARLPSSQLQSAARQRAGIYDWLVRYNDLLLIQIQQSVACNALHPLESRLCRWLLQTHEHCEGDTIPLTQEFLAQMLGVRRTTVTVAARLLQSAGMIRYRRGLIQIIDRPALEEASCECYSVVKRRIDEVFPVLSSPR
jgi:CRP-like cAMP-binding protein